MNFLLSPWSPSSYLTSVCHPTFFASLLMCRVLQMDILYFPVPYGCSSTNLNTRLKECQGITTLLLHLVLSKSFTVTTHLSLRDLWLVESVRSGSGQLCQHLFNFLVSGILCLMRLGNQQSIYNFLLLVASRKLVFLSLAYIDFPVGFSKIPSWVLDYVVLR